MHIETHEWIMLKHAKCAQMLQHKGIIPVAASATFEVVGRTSALLGVSSHTIHEQTVSTDSCPLKVLDFGGNKLATLRKMASSTIFTMCPRSSSTFIPCSSPHTTLDKAATNEEHSFTRWPSLPHRKHTRDSTRHIHQSVASHNWCTA